MIDALRQQPQRLGRIGTIAIAHEETAKRRQVCGDVATRRLHLTAHRNTEPVVFDVKHHRKRERRRHRQRGPEAIRGDRSFAAKDHRDRALVGRVA